MATRAEAAAAGRAFFARARHERRDVAEGDGAAAWRALRFTSALLCICLFLQRFGVPLGAKAFSLVGPVGLAYIAYAVMQRTLVLHRLRLASYLVLAIGVLAGLAWQGLSPRGDFDGGVNLQSMLQFLLLTSFAVLTFAVPVDEKRFFGRVNFWFAIIAIAGVLQFAAQFVGVRVFAFTGILPWQMLYEFGYNLQIPVGVGDLFKSNGFFLIEPSTFSQVMALGLIIEMLAFRRPKYLVLFVAGLLLSFSGTGWIVLASFLIAAVLGMGWRGMAIAAATVVVLGVAVGVASLVAPDLTNAFQARIDEVARPGTSGHRRFVTPFWVLSDTLEEHPSAALVGLGSGVSERLHLAYEYDVNTPVKIALDDGFPALLAYVLLFVMGRKSPIQAALVVPACTMFFFAGAYQQFPPIVFLILLLTSVARLRKGDQKAGDGAGETARRAGLPRASSIAAA